MKIAKDITNRLEGIEPRAELKDSGRIASLSDGVAWVEGLGSAMYGEVLQFTEETHGLILNLEENRVGAIIFGDYEKLSVGDDVFTTGSLLEIGVSEEILGRVVDSLGNPLDGEGSYKKEQYLPVDKIAPGIVNRQPVSEPLQTGILAIDSMIPIGKGQRELIIGDRGTGKTAVAIDAIINQKDNDVVSVYVAVGQKRAKIAQVIEKLQEYGVMNKTVVVSASASDPASMRYIAPYAGTAIGEYFMEKGKDVLVVYDDLSKHAWSYREISLLLRRPSGREAYPGDVFYLHSRLLERSARLSEEHGGGSLTALPIIETQSGDVSAYIPTNVISITDGQIYLESDLFFAGIRPALNVGLSVSRVGGAAQIKAMKKIAGPLRLDLSQYWELETFAQFATDLDESTKSKIDRGKRIIEILKQPQYQPIPVEMQVLIIYLATSGYLDDIPLEYVNDFKNEFMSFVNKNHKVILKEISKTNTFEEELKVEADKAIKVFVEKFKTERAMEEDSE